MAVWREGTTGPLGNKAVDMMDNARALPTCPQRQQIAASLRNGRMIEAETAEIPIKKTAQVVLPMGSTSKNLKNYKPLMKSGLERTDGNCGR